MEIVWYGHACCALTEGDTTIITDPFDESLGFLRPRLTADIVTVSHDTANHSAVDTIQGAYKLIDRPGEYEIQGVFITSRVLDPPGIRKTANGRSRNLVFIFEMEDLTVCHLGDLNHVPMQHQTEVFQTVDILLIPVGGGKSLNAAQASEVINLIEPSIVIPIHYELPGIKIELDPVDRFLKEMGQSSPNTETKLRIRRSSLPEETQIVVLEPQIKEV